MLINLIIDQLLPMRPRLVSLVPRSSWTITSSNLIGARSYSSGHFYDSLKPNIKTTPQGQLAVDMKDHQIQSECLRDAQAAHANANNYSIDAASPNIRPDPSDRTQGNPEGMGMLDQVGSATGTAKFFEGGGSTRDEEELGEPSRCIEDYLRITILERILFEFP